MKRTDAYKFTVNMENGKVVMEHGRIVEVLRECVKASNRINGTKKYVKLQGRGPRPSRRYHQSLPLSMATSADVYVYERR